MYLPSVVSRVSWKEGALLGEGEKGNGSSYRHGFNLEAIPVSYLSSLILYLLVVIL